MSVVTAPVLVPLDRPLTGAFLSLLHFLKPRLADVPYSIRLVVIDRR